MKQNQMSTNLTPIPTPGFQNFLIDLLQPYVPYPCLYSRGGLLKSNSRYI